MRINRIRSFLIRKWWNPNFFPKQQRFWDLQRFSTVVNQRIHEDFMRESFESDKQETVRNRTRFNNLPQFVVCMCIPTVESCLGERFKTIKPSFFHFWVDSSGLGFQRGKERAAGEEEKKREKHFEKMKKTGFQTLLYKLLDRVDPNPVHSLLLRTVWSRSRGIWINPTLLEC